VRKQASLSPVETHDQAQRVNGAENRQLLRSSPTQSHYKPTPLRFSPPPPCPLLFFSLAFPHCHLRPLHSLIRHSLTGYSPIPHSLIGHSSVGHSSGRMTT